MLAAYFDIKPRDPGHQALEPSPPRAPPSAERLKHARQTSQPKQTKRKEPKQGAKSKAAKKPEPYDDGAVHARFLPSATTSEPQGVPGHSVLDPEPLCEDEDRADEDSYEYLWMEAQNMPSAAEEDDTDSCLTFDDDASDATETLSTSPAEPVFDVLDRAFSNKRKAKASETPVYSGPELWFEDDDFIA